MVKSEENGSFIWFSDLHYDPLYGQVGASDSTGQGCSEDTASSEGQIGCDSPLSLIKSAVLAAKDVWPEPDFVLVTGDLARHGMDRLDHPEAALKEIFDAIAQLFKDNFPSIIFCLGNNDGRADYFFNVSDPEVLGMAISSDLNSTFVGVEAKMFLGGGYYARSISDHGHSDKVKVLSLNTVIYSIEHLPRSSSNDPLGQFAWLESVLSEARANGGYVMVVGHIPPTIGSYRKSQFWQDRYLDRYLALVDEYADVVSAQLFGHLHSDEFRVLPFSSEDAPPLLLTSSVTPVYGGNPSFRVVSYDTERGNIADYTTYYLNLVNKNTSSAWHKLYSFREAYGAGNLTASTMQTIVDSIGDGGKAMDTFISNQRIGAPQAFCGEQCRAEWACVLTAATRKQYDACVPAASRQSGSRQQQLTLAAAAAGLVAFVFVGCLVFLCYRRKTERNYEDVAEFDVDADQDELSLT